LFATLAGYLIAIRGSDCKFLWSARSVEYSSNIAVADLDDDGFPEIVGTQDDAVIVFDRKGNVLAKAARKGWSNSPLIRRFEAGGPPLIVLERSVFKYSSAHGLIAVRLDPSDATKFFSVSVVADLESGGPSLITGARIYEGMTGVDMSPSELTMFSGASDSLPVVADLNGDGRPDLWNVRFRAGEVWVWFSP